MDISSFSNDSFNHFTTQQPACERLPQFFKDPTSALSAIPTDLQPLVCDYYVTKHNASNEFIINRKIAEFSSIMEKYKNINRAHLPQPVEQVLVEMLKDYLAGHKLNDSQIFLLGEFVNFDVLDSLFELTNLNGYQAEDFISKRYPMISINDSGLWLYRNSSVPFDPHTGAQARTLTALHLHPITIKSRYAHMRLNCVPGKGYAHGTGNLDTFYKTAIELLLNVALSTHFAISKYQSKKGGWGYASVNNDPHPTLKLTIAERNRNWREDHIKFQYGDLLG